MNGPSTSFNSMALDNAHNVSVQEDGIVGEAAVSRPHGRWRSNTALLSWAQMQRLCVDQSKMCYLTSEVPEPVNNHELEYPFIRLEYVDVLLWVEEDDEVSKLVSDDKSPTILLKALTSS
ncbi:hypothetical protein chiPu_0001700 [Chiloscyllium punctatum]|uniref:Uncharacterized protein n=1 Tax=Chiloscyllium punctatum TaxID=137246 RepID=A0A401RYT7_CHIPU|nr:hypothetical protein [Chiloscyllium punctatum]